MMKKLINIVIILLQIIFATNTYSLAYDNLDPQNTKNIKNKIEDISKLIPNNQKDIVDQYMRPVITNKEMQTLDGSKSFTSQLQCQSNNIFFTLKTSLNKDSYNINYKVDNNLDGNFDYSKNFSQVSGVCSNGIISCDVNSWDNCQYYKWAVTNGRLTLNTTSPDNIGGCYCINGSCINSTQRGSLQKTITSDIAGGGVSVLMNNNANFIISKTLLLQNKIDFFGQSAKSCSDFATIENDDDINNIVKSFNADDMETNLTNLTIQNKNNNNVYQTLIQSQLTKNTISSYQSCNIEKKYNFQYNCYCHIEDQEIRACGADCTPQYIIEISDWKYTTKYDASATNKIYITDSCDGNIQNSFNVNNYSKDCNDFDIVSIKKNCWWMCDDYTVEYRERTFKRIIDEEFPKTAENKVFNSCYISSNNTINNCTEWENDSSCVLKTELVDGVKTYDLYKPTLKKALPLIKNVGTTSCVLNITNNWWLKEREYECSQDKQYNFEEGIKRKQTIDKSIKNNSYQDVIKNNTYNQNIDIPKINGSDVCINSCKLIKNTNKIDVGVKGVVKTGNNLTNKDFRYRECVGISNNVCPSEQDEEIITDCSCINEFPIVTTIMQVLRHAGNDVICSTGNSYEL